MKKLIALILALVMVIGMLSACGPKEPAAETPPVADAPATNTPATNEKETATEVEETGEINYLRFPVGFNDTLSALKTLSVSGYQVVWNLLCGTLVKLDVEANEFVPALADKWEVSPDGTVYTVTLGDHTFHDGTPITADDVVFSYEYQIFSGGTRVSYASSLVGFDAARNGETDTVEGIKKIDDKTVTFTLTAPNQLFMYALANSNFGIIPASYFEGMSWTEIGEYEDFWKAPVGSGAYMIDQTQYPNYITLKAYEDFYDPASLKNVLMTCYTDGAASDAAMIAGEIDWEHGWSYGGSNEILAVAGDVVRAVPYDCSYQRYFMLNVSDKAGDTTTHPSLSNTRVRQALNMLLDKDAIAVFFGEGVVPLNGHLNTTNPNYNTDLPTWERDVDGAVAILKEEGFDFDTPIRIFANYTDQETADFLELVKQQLGEGGVQVTYTIDSNWQNYLTTADYDFRYAGTSKPIDVDWYSQIAIGGQTDYTKGNYRMDDPDFVATVTERYDDLIAAYKSEQDPNKQKEILDQLQYNAYEDMLIMPLYSMGQRSMFSSRFTMPILTSDNYEFAEYQFSTWTLAE